MDYCLGSSGCKRSRQRTYTAYSRPTIQFQTTSISFSISAALGTQSSMSTLSLADVYTFWLIMETATREAAAWETAICLHRRLDLSSRLLGHFLISWGDLNTEVKKTWPVKTLDVTLNSKIVDKNYIILRNIRHLYTLSPAAHFREKIWVKSPLFWRSALV